MAVLTRPLPPPFNRWPAPVAPGPRSAEPGRLYALDIRMWDMHAARGLERRLLAAGVAPNEVRIRGNRCADGLVEADVRPWSRMTTRWKVNIVVAIASAVIVGVPVGAAIAIILLGEHAIVMSVGAFVGGVGTGAIGLLAVWGDHFQRFAGSRSDTRLEGLVTVTGSTAVVRAEMLLATSDDVMSVQRLPIDLEPATTR